MIRFCCARHDRNDEARMMMTTSLDGLQMAGNYGEAFAVWFEGTVL
jgi:hypothetical protein